MNINLLSFVSCKWNLECLPHFIKYHKYLGVDNFLITLHSNPINSNELINALSILREFNIDIITTSPSVKYNIILRNKKITTIDNPTHFPDPSYIDYIEEYTGTPISIVSVGADRNCTFNRRNPWTKY